MKTLLARFATSFPDALRGVTVFSAMLLLIVALEESAWAQAGRVRSGGGGVSDEVLMFARWAGLVIAIIIVYLLSFHLFFPTLLKNGTWPLTAYGASWAIFFGVGAVVALALLWIDMMPDRVTPKTNKFYIYKYHIVVLVGGFVLSLAPLLILRSRNDAEQPD